MALLYLGASAIGSFELAKRYWSGETTKNPRFEVVVPLPQNIGNRYLTSGSNAINTVTGQPQAATP